MRNKKKMMVLLGAGLLLLTVSVAAFSEVSVLFQAASGKVEVHLEEFMRENGEEIPWEDGQVILPGGVVSKIPRICNDGEPCYVRASVEFEKEDISGSPLTTEQLVGIEKDWVHTGEYFYYKNILPENGTVDFFQGIQIPPEWESGADDGQVWSADVKVDAVQAEYFTPDFENPDPWGMNEKGYEIQKAVKEVPEDEGDQDQVQETIKFEIEQEMKGFSVNSQEFFRNLDLFVPGKSQSGLLEFSNQSKQTREVYMRSEILEENELLDELELTIQIRKNDHTEVIYQGKLSADQLQEYQSLGKIPAKEKETVEFLIHLPEEADNRYSVEKGSVKFRFTTDLPEYRAGVGPVKTGDEYKWKVLAEMFFSAVCLIVCTYIFFKKYREKQKGGRE